MESLASNLIDLLLLVILQAVLGFDNLLYISLESKKAPLEAQSKVRTIGIALAIILRIGLLFLLWTLKEAMEASLFGFDSYIASGHFSLDSLITLFGGLFVIYTAIKEIFHMISVQHDEDNLEKQSSTIGSVIFWIVLMNVVFSFDSILSAMALSENIYVMSSAIVISGVLMIWMSDKVSTFLAKNRLYEILGLFVLFIVGIMLVTEGGHKAHLRFFGNPILAMEKTTFYFIIGILVVVDIVQGKFQKKMLKNQD